MRRSLLLVVVILAVVVVAIGIGVRTFLAGPGATTVAPPPSPLAVPTAGAPTFVGGEACAECHAREHERWVGSHHDLAMQPATAETVLGDFDDATFTCGDVTSSFFRREEAFVVRTDGADGTLHDYPVAYTFGVEPLQQYLIELPGGRLQALSICWDTRPREEGGQRWFHLYPNEVITHDDELHWTRRSQNWNTMCAECHSTNLVKGYDLADDRYETTWSEIDVSCEACHGPGSAHVAWAEADAEGGAADPGPGLGLLVSFEVPRADTWIHDGETPTAQRREPLASRSEIETCARCHARRAAMHDGGHVPGRPLLDTHLLRGLDEGFYHVDGQILDEVYVYGSFLQSRMYHQGVTCSDCHDPHDLALLAPGNLMCARCHVASTFDVPAHHHHQPGEPGASCVDCHMPSRTYMVVDPRRDHSLRVPRPDLSVRLGTPNACNDCHQDQTAEWAAGAVVEWYGEERRQEPHYGETLAAGRAGRPDAGPVLTALATDPEKPAIARATALDLLRRCPGPPPLAALAQALTDDDPLVRRAATGALELAPETERARLGAPMLTDPVRGVRTEAARVLAPLPPGVLPRGTSAALAEASAEYLRAELANAEQPWAHTNVGNFLVRRGDVPSAAAAYEQALRLDPAFVPAAVNLADLLRATQRDDEGERVLRDALRATPDAPALLHTLGLLLVRQGRTAEALDALARATEGDPAHARFAYVYAIALNSTGAPRRAIDVLEAAHARHPVDLEILAALARFHGGAGDPEAARRYADELVGLAPDVPAFRRLRDELRSARGR